MCAHICACGCVGVCMRKWIYIYKLLTKVINKDCCQNDATMKVMMIVMTVTDLMTRQQLSLMTMMTVMRPLFVCECVCT